MKLHGRLAVSVVARKKPRSLGERSGRGASWPDEVLKERGWWMCRQGKGEEVDGDGQEAEWTSKGVRALD